MVKNKKAKKRSLAEVNDEPDFLGQALKKTRQHNSSAIQSLYKDDVGFGQERLKSKRDTPQGASVDIRLSADEKRKRNERQVRLNLLHFGCESALRATLTLSLAIR